MAEARIVDQFGWQSSALLLTAQYPASDDSAALITAMGARIVANLPLVDGAARLKSQAPVDLIMVEAGGADEGELTAAMDATLAFADSSGCSIVVVIDPDQIDAVSAMMLGGPHSLLCAPSAAERLGAITAALHRGGSTSLNEAGRDNDALGLSRLNEEVARIAETLARLTRAAGESADRGRAAFADPPAAIHDTRRGYHGNDGDAATAADIRRIIRGRRLRDQILGEGLFEDPAWDILLDLYAAHLEGNKVSVSSLCIAAAVPPTTALRWIGRMSELGMLERRPDPFDRRRAYMAPAEATIDGMARYFTALRQNGLMVS
ncbi:hypothetical protein ACLB0R_06015 [Sphingomonas sp. GlSt437]